MSNILYIINPAGQGGMGPKAWEKFKTLWPQQIDSEQVIVTERLGHAREIAASSEGYDILTAVGGDGTAGEIMSGIMEHQEPRPCLAIIPGGTGNDIARNAGIRSVEDGVRALRGGQTRAFDLIRVDYRVDDKMEHGYAFLQAIAGFSAIPMVKPWMKRLLGPTGAYYLGTLLQFVVFRPPHMTVRTETRELDLRSWMVIVGNSERTSGNSMCLAPGAVIDDGELNITVLPSHSKLKMITRIFPRIASGEHVNEPGVSYFPARKIEVDSDPPSILDLDGDICGMTPAAFTVCPRIMQIMTPPNNQIVKTSDHSLRGRR